MPKTNEKGLYNHIRVALCEKMLEKTIKFKKKENIFKIDKNSHFLKTLVMQNDQKWLILAVNFKVPKIDEKPLENHIIVVFCKKGSKKHLICEKLQYF